MPERRELYRSPNGDSWFLGREPENGHAFIIHQPNAPSGGRLSHIELGEFLRSGNGPKQQSFFVLRERVGGSPPYPKSPPKGHQPPADVIGNASTSCETD